MATDLTTLIQGSLKGKPLAQRALFEHLSPYVLAVVRRYGIPERSRADVFQNTFLSIFQRLDCYDASRSAFSTWATGHAINKCLDYHKRQHRFTTVDMEAIPPAHFPDSSALHLMEDDYLIDLIARLPVGYRTVFNLYVIDGYKHAEIAEQLGITESSSRSQFSRARRILQRQITALKAAMYVLL